MRLRRYYTLSWLILFAPVYFLYLQLNPPATVERNVLLQNHAVGPWQVTLTATNRNPGLNATQSIDFEMRICEQCNHPIRAVFLSYDAPRANYGNIFNGGPKVFSTALTVSPTSPNKDKHLWLTIEDWGGKVHQTKVPVKRIAS